MSFSLAFTDGTTTISLTTDPNGVVEYTPVTPKDGAVAYSEFADALCEGESAITTLEQSLNRMFAQARRYQQKKRGPRVYVQFQKDSDLLVWRGEVYTGSMVWNAKTLDTDSATELYEFRVTWVREVGWEASEMSLPLTNGNGSNVISGLEVRDHDDGGAGDDNTVFVAAANIKGDLPSPAKLEITNTYNSGSRAYKFFVGHNVDSAPGTFNHVLEGEDSTAGGTDTPNGSSSAGAYMARSWTGPGEVIAYRWTLSSALLSAAAGGWFRVIARLASPLPSNNPPMRIRVKVQMSGLSDIYEGPWLAVGEETLQSWDAVQLPPWLLGTTTVGALDLVIEARHDIDVADTTRLNIDFVHLFPMDGWRELTPRGFGLQYTEKLVDDQIEDRLYTLNGSSAYGHYKGSGEIMLVPGRDQRFYFLHTNDTGGAQIDRTLSVRVLYRARRITLFSNG